MLPSPGRLNRAHCGFGHENRVYLSCAGVVSVITVLLWQGMDGKIPGRRQFRHVTILQDYLDDEDPVYYRPSYEVPGYQDDEQVRQSRRREREKDRRAEESRWHR